MISREHRPPPPPGTPGSVPPPSSSQRSRAGAPPAAIAISCNRCRKPLSTTVFVCSCDCTFCEECTYNHFNSSSNCPVCNKVLSEHDFTELVVADPPATPSSNRASTFQTLFTKQNAASRALPFQDLCARMLKQQDDSRAGNKFLMKQFLVETTNQAKRFQQLYRAFDGLKQEHTALKQSTNTQKVRYEKALENMQQQLASANKKIEEKERQIYQFRKLHDRMTPESPSHGGGSGGGARRVSTGSDRNSSGSDSRQAAINMIPPGSRLQHQQQQQQQPPPMQGFMIQKEAQERARQRALEAPHQRTPVLGHRNGDGHGSGGRAPHHQQQPSNPYATPRSSGSHGSGSGGIRDLSASSGYAFSGGGTGPTDNKRRRAMSPSQAFAMQPPGSYSVARGPSNYFQQQGGGGYMSGRH